VTGVLLAPGVEAVNVTGIDPETVDEAEYKDQYTSLPGTIGHDWKRFDFTAGWIITDDQAFFVKTKAKDKYKLVFLDFEGSQTGTATFDATFLQNTSSSTDLLNDVQVDIYPNPTAEFITIGTAETKDVKVEMFSILGQKVHTIHTKTNTQISLSDLGNHAMIALLITMDGKSFVKNIIINN
jgi:hypothetical protein